jgi:hypothetical protein
MLARCEIQPVKVNFSIASGNESFPPGVGGTQQERRPRIIKPIALGKPEPNQPPTNGEGSKFYAMGVNAV